MGFQQQLKKGRNMTEMCNSHESKKLKLFSYKTSKTDLKDFVAMEVSQITGL